MNSTVCISTDAELDRISSCGTDFDIYDGAGDNATAPMAVVLPPYTQPNEEELHTAFEQAISGRVTAMHERLSRLNSAQLLSQRTLRDTDPLLTFGMSRTRSRRTRKNFQRYVIFIGFALMCMLIGFDVMGLLVLHMLH